MNAYIIICLVLIVYWKLKNQYAKRLTIEYQYKLYDLRDNLREATISGKIDKNNWQFQYLDGSISKTVNELSSVNIYTTLFLATKYKGDKNFINHTIKIKNGVEENQYTLFFYEEYRMLITRYVFRKHFMLKVTIVFHIISALLSISLFNRFKTWVKKAVGNFTVAPETSQGYDIPGFPSDYNLC